MTIIGTRAVFLWLGLSLCTAPFAPAGEECGRGPRRLLYRASVVAGARGTATVWARFDTRVGGEGARYVLMARCPGHRHALVRGHRCPGPGAAATINLNGAPVLATDAGCRPERLEVTLNPVGGPPNTIVTTIVGPPGSRIEVAVVALGPGRAHPGGSCNTPPTADAGPDQTLPLEARALLDGSGSTDADGDALGFEWSFVSVPSGSRAVLSDPAAVDPTFVMDAPGTYVVKLVVHDGRAQSAPDTVSISTENSPPVADAGPDRPAFVGIPAVLDGSGSSDADGDPLTFAWSVQSRPPGSAASLDDPTAVRPTLIPDRPGTYEVQLVVDDGRAASAPDAVLVTTANTPPVADAGTDQTVSAGAQVTLDGSGSTDVDGDALSYAWSLTSVPPGSLARLDDPVGVRPRFVADRPGVYVAQLLVDDGLATSDPDTARVTTEGSPPVADAGPDQTVVAGQLVVLDGTGSSDPDGDPLAFAWSFTSRPSGSSAVLSGAGPTPTFTADRPGAYVVQLVVNDGSSSSAPDTVTVSTLNSAPVADAGPDQEDVALGAIVVLDGSGSSDADGQPLVYSWALLSKPAGSAADLTGADTASAELTPDLAGDYVAQLIVNDGFVDSAPDTVTVSAVADAELGVVSIEAVDPDAAEAGRDPGAFTIRRTGDTSRPLGVALSQTGSAGAADHGGFSLFPTIPVGAAATTISVLPLPDNLVEGPETVVLTLSPSLDYVVGTPASATVTIADDPPVVSVIATDPDAAEVGPDDGRFTFTRIGGDLAAALPVGFTRGGTADVSDFVPIGASVTISAAETTATVTVTPVGDGLVEGAETVVLTVEASANVAVGTFASATVTIADSPAAVVTVVATDSTATEAGDAGSFTLSRAGSLSGPLTVAYELVGTATNGVDFQALPGTATFPAGSDAVALAVVPIDDADLESTEGAHLQLRPGPGYVVGTPGAAVVTIADDDTLVSVVASDAVAAENGPDPGVYTVSRLGPPAEALTVSYALSGTAAAGVDYAVLPGSVTFPPGATEAAVVLDPLDDALLEGPESAVLTLSPGPGYKVGALAAATVTIQDDERPAVSVTVSDAAASEAGTDAGSFSVTRTGPTAGPLTVFYDVAGAATPGVDYTALAGSVTIPAGAAAAAVVVTPIDDTLIEGAESVLLTLRADPAYVVVTPGIALLNIADDDLSAVSLLAADPDANEVGPDAGRFTLSRSGDPSAPLVVALTRSGTATNASDYASLGGVTFTVTIPSGEVSLDILLLPLADNVVEGDESVVLSVVPNLAYVVGSPASATVTIGDDAPVVSLDAADPEAAEADLDPAAFVLTRRGGNTAAAMSVSLSIGGTALANRDYVVLSGVATIPAGQTTVAVAVTPLRDNLVEPPETVVVTVLPGTGTVYLVGSPSVATVTIADDPPVVSVIATDPDAAEAGLDPGTVSFTRTGGDSDAALNVFFTKSGTATNGADYASLGGANSLVVIPAGQSSAGVSVVPLADNLVEGREEALFSLSPNAGYAIGAPASASVAIADDPPVVSVSATDSVAAESGPDPGVFTFTRSGGNPAAALTVSFTRGGTAANVSDFVTIPSSVTIPAGQPSATITITPIDDTLVEGAETVVLTVNPGASVVVGTPASATVTIEDDD